MQVLFIQSDDCTKSNKTVIANIPWNTVYKIMVGIGVKLTHRSLSGNQGIQFMKQW